MSPTPNINGVYCNCDICKGGFKRCETPLFSQTPPKPDEPQGRKCPDCFGTGMLDNGDGFRATCNICNGSGQATKEDKGWPKKSDGHIDEDGSKFMACCDDTWNNALEACKKVHESVVAELKEENAHREMELYSAEKKIDFYLGLDRDRVKEIDKLNALLDKFSAICQKQENSRMEKDKRIAELKAEMNLEHNVNEAEISRLRKAMEGVDHILATFPFHSSDCVQVKDMRGIIQQALARTEEIDEPQKS